jgi:hypothetical protein
VSELSRIGFQMAQMMSDGTELKNKKKKNKKTKEKIE